MYLIQIYEKSSYKYKFLPAILATILSAIFFFLCFYLLENYFIIQFDIISLNVTILDYFVLYFCTIDSKHSFQV